MMLAVITFACFVFATIALPIENDGKISSNNTNPELNGGGFEGDILLPPVINSARGVAIKGAIRRWPNKVIPYDISAITNINDRKLITDAMNRLMFDVGTPIPGQEARQFCVRFRPSQSGDSEVLKIQYGLGCSANVGFGIGYQKSLNLDSQGCFYSGIVQHELTHVLGFFHEQSRPDRDSYITVHQENIDPVQMHNFEKYEWNGAVEAQGSNYDYGSIMHYPNNAFTMNGKPTISTRQQNVQIGQRVQLSPTDIYEIRHYYNC